MDQQSKAKLEAKGWQVGTATDFLSLTTEDSLIIEIKLALTRRLEERQQDDTSGAITHPTKHRLSYLPRPTHSRNASHWRIPARNRPNYRQR